MSRWQAESATRYGCEPADWRDREVGLLAVAVAQGRSIEPAAEAYGRGRCQASWTLPEVLDDLEDLMKAVPDLPDPARWALIRATAGGWSQQVIAETLSAPFRDALTGLPTAGYLALRAEPLYAAESAAAVAESHSLVFVHLHAPRGFAGIERLLDLAGLVHRSLGPHSDLAALGRHGVAALIENTAADYERAMDLARPGELEVSLEPMPATLAAFEARLAEHSRRV